MILLPHVWPDEGMQSAFFIYLLFFFSNITYILAIRTADLFESIFCNLILADKSKAKFLV